MPWVGGEAKYCSNGSCSGLLPYDDNEEAEREGEGGDGEGRGRGKEKRRGGKEEQRGNPLQDHILHGLLFPSPFRLPIKYQIMNPSMALPTKTEPSWSGHIPKASYLNTALETKF